MTWSCCVIKTLPVGELEFILKAPKVEHSTLIFVVINMRNLNVINFDVK